MRPDLLIPSGHVWVCWADVWISDDVTFTAEVSNTVQPPLGVCVTTWYMCEGKDRGASCAPDVDLTSILAILVLNKPHPCGGRWRDDWFHTLELILHACLFKPAGAPSVSGSLCHSLCFAFSHFTVHLPFYTHSHMPVGDENKQRIVLFPFLWLAAQTLALMQSAMWFQW